MSTMVIDVGCRYFRARVRGQGFASWGLGVVEATAQTDLNVWAVILTRLESTEQLRGFNEAGPVPRAGPHTAKLPEVVGESESLGKSETSHGVVCLCGSMTV